MTQPDKQALLDEIDAIGKEEDKLSDRRMALEARLTELITGFKVGDQIRSVPLAVSSAKVIERAKVVRMTLIDAFTAMCDVQRLQPNGKPERSGMRVIYIEAEDSPGYQGKKYEKL